MSPVCSLGLKTAGGFPRVSGDEPPGVGVGASARVFSPRERG